MSAKVLVITKIPCAYCTAAKNFLKDQGIAFEEKDLTGKSGEMMRLKSETGWSTFPMIFINGTLIGGYQDMKELHDQGELEKLLS